MKLYYTKPAGSWMEALPLGNGTLGAAVYSGATLDRIQINEDTLWSGHPQPNAEWLPADTFAEIRSEIDRGTYRDASDHLSRTMPNAHSQGYLFAGELNVELVQDRILTKDYARRLDLDTATLTNTYTVASPFSPNADCGHDPGHPDNQITRTVFASAPDGVLVYRIHTSEPCRIRVALSSDLRYSISDGDKTLMLDGICPSVANMYENDVQYEADSIRYRMAVRAACDCDWYCSGSALYFLGTTDLTLYTTVCTSFNGFDRNPVTDGREYRKAALDRLAHAAERGYDHVYARHVADYQSLFHRVSLSLGEDNGRPTDERIADPENDPQLAALLFDYGRYLLIACSRPGTQPANLQGIWNRLPIAPWHSNYTMNINTQMNYWPAEPCALGDCHEPMFRLVRELASRGNCLGLPGWASWHNSDLWRFGMPATRGVSWGFWLMGGFWACRHLWEHYQYTLDRDFLAQAYPIFTGALDFLKAWTVEKNGYFTTCPSTSPENQFLDHGQPTGLAFGSAMDLTIITELCRYTERAAAILGRDFSPYRDWASRIQPLTVGSDERLLEWGTELPEQDPGHRHVSHLYGVYPSDVLRGTGYWEPARKSLLHRMANGGGHTGWSNAWIACLYARFHDSARAAERIDAMFRRSIYPNLLDAHPPFQIDGNFGITAAIAEMLLQSYEDGDGYVLEILPAKPAKWTAGSVHGLRARGGLTVDIDWAPGKQPTVRVDNPHRVPVRLQFFD